MNNIETTIDNLVDKIEEVRRKIANMVELDGDTESTANLTQSLYNIENTLKSIKTDAVKNKNVIESKKRFLGFN